MFERYTEKARRVIFFARYEASQFGSSFIETEHLLLGLFREDKELASRFLQSDAAVESIRMQIEAQTAKREKVSTSVDLPLSHECKRALAYGAEESERLAQQHIGTAHLMLGLLREEGCFASRLLRDHGVKLTTVREQIARSALPATGDGAVLFPRLEQWLAEIEAGDESWTVKKSRVANGGIQVAVYAVDQPKEGEDETPAGNAARIQERIESIVQQMEHAIGAHQFDQARLFSEEEKKEREKLRSLLEQFNLKHPPPRVPLLCIEIFRDDRFSEVQKRCDDYIARGVPQVWLLHFGLRRAYTVTKAEGLREFRGPTLQYANPPLAIDLNRIFD